MGVSQHQTCRQCKAKHTSEVVQGCATWENYARDFSSWLSFSPWWPADPLSTRSRSRRSGRAWPPSSLDLSPWSQSSFLLPVKRERQELLRMLVRRMRRKIQRNVLQSAVTKEDILARMLRRADLSLLPVQI